MERVHGDLSTSSGMLALLCGSVIACSSGSIQGRDQNAAPSTPGSSGAIMQPGAAPAGQAPGTMPALSPALDPVTGEAITPGRAPAVLAGVGADPGANPATDPYKLFDSGEPVTGCAAEFQTQVASTPLRRLTREQYNNTVRDLFGRAGVEAPRLAGAFSPDNYAGSFPANADVVASERHIRAYADAAERITSGVSASIAKLVPCDVSAGDAGCARSFILDFAMRAYRRPVEQRQLDALLRIYEVGAAGGFEHGIALIIEAVLQSPYFLYHVEYTPALSEPAIALDSYELAARLSYFLWDSMPDDALLAVARDGSLNTAEVLRQQAERMLDDPRAQGSLGSFTTHWLELDGLADLAPDNAVFPNASLDLPPDALAETLHFVDHVVRGEGDGTLDSLLTAQYSFPTQSLWTSYGVRAPAGYDGSTPLQLPAGQRAGVLTHVSTLFKHSHNQLGPIRRGKYILNSILCQEISFPENVEINLDLANEAGSTTRQKLENLTRRAECMGCHNLINPIGFAFDGYNQIGVYNSGANQDGALNVPDYQMGPARGAVELAARISQSDAARSCMVKQMHRFALRRKEASADTCSLSTLARAFAGSPGSDARFNVRRLMLDIVAQNSFRFQAGR